MADLSLPNVTDPLELGLNALRDFLASKVPALAGLIVVGEAESEDQRDPPFLQIAPAGSPRLETFLGPDDVVDDSRASAVGGAPGQLVVQSGEWVGTVQLTLAVALPSQRAALGAAIVQALLGTDEADEDGHGVRTLPLGQQMLLGDRSVSGKGTASFAMTSTTWDDERAFTRDRRQVLELDASVSAMLVRAVPGTQDEITVRRALGTSLDTADSTVVTSDQVLDENTV